MSWVVVADESRYQHCGWASRNHPGPAPRSARINQNSHNCWTRVSGPDISGYQDTAGPEDYYKLGARYYDGQGHFTQPDPLAGSVSDPRTMTAFNYGGADPINRSDPTGRLFGFSIKKAVGNVFAGAATLAGAGIGYVLAAEGFAALTAGGGLGVAALGFVGFATGGVIIGLAVFAGYLAYKKINE